MPQTHCFPKQRDLSPSSFYAAAKDLGQNQSFKDFIEEVQRFIGQQPSVVWFVCISSGNLQASEELASHNQEGHSLPCGSFLPGIYDVGEGSQEESIPYKGLVSAAPSSCSLPSHQPGINESTNDTCIVQGERQWDERWEVKCDHFFLPLVMGRRPAPGSEAPSMCAHGLVFLVHALGKLNIHQESFKHSFV